MPTDTGLKSADELVVSGLARWLIYGDNGVGKTTFLSTLQGPWLVVSAVHENIKPLVGCPNIKVWQLRHWDDMELIYRVLSDKRNPFVGVAFDTFTRCLAFGAEKVMGVSRDSATMAQYLKNPPAVGTATYKTWTSIGNLGLEAVRNFNSLPTHVIYLCQEESIQPKVDTDTVHTRPLLIGNVAWAGIKDIVEIVGRLYVEEAEYGDIGETKHRDIDPHMQETRRLLIGKHPRYFAKGPTRLLGYTIEDPTWDKLAVSLKGAA